MSAALRLYDLAAADERVRFSPYCWRTRLALAHKDLPVETVAWRFTDKEAIAFSGQGKVPVLVDGERCVHDSWAIACYLEERYPERPSLFGGEVGRALARFVNQWAVETLHPLIARTILPDLVGILHEKDVDYFRRTREAVFGMPIEALAEEREHVLGALRAALRPLESTLGAQAYLSGESPMYADHICFGAFQWARAVSPLALLEPLPALTGWFERMLDAYGGIGRGVPAAA